MQDCLRFSDHLHSFNLEIKLIYGPLFEINHLPLSKSPVANKKLIFTSKNAIESLLNSKIVFRGQAFCVGSGTAKKARECGIDSISADGNVLDLLQIIKNSTNPESCDLLYYRGEEISWDLGLELRKLNYSVDEIICYEKVPKYYDLALKNAIADGVITGAVFFSKNTASLFSKNVASLPNGFYCFCMSRSISNIIEQFYHSDQITIKTARHPTTKSMVNLIIAAYGNKK